MSIFYNVLVSSLGVCKMCEYEYRDGTKCQAQSLPHSKYCILHADFPTDEENEEFARISNLKEEAVAEKIEKADFNFEGAKLVEVDLSGKTINDDLNCSNALIRKDISLENAEVSEDVFFRFAKIGGNALFGDAKIGGFVVFTGTEIGGDARFDRIHIKKSARFSGAEIEGDAQFSRAVIDWFASFLDAKIGGSGFFRDAKIDGYTAFLGVEIGGSAVFTRAEIGGSVNFTNAKISESAWFTGAKIDETLTFRDTTFEKPRTQERACRKAKKINERIGDREAADYHFYREMEAKRMQKKGWKRFEAFFEWLLADVTTKYGTSIPRLSITFFCLSVVIFPVSYYLGSTMGGGMIYSPGGDTMLGLDLLYYSLMTFISILYRGMYPSGWYMKACSLLEAFLGTVYIALIIALLTRKWMR